MTPHSNYEEYEEGTAIMKRKYWLLRDEELHQIAAHKYKGGEYTRIDLLMNPFWNLVTGSLPLSLAPNVITLIGLACIVCGTALTLVYSPSLEASLLSYSSTSSGDATVIPPYVFFINCLAVFLYQTCDAVDGKQARRTGTSSPVGQLIDHGCDTLVLVCQWLGGGAAVGLGISWYTAGACLAVQAAFFSAQLEEYHTDKLNWSLHGVFGVTEVQLAIAGGYLFTGIWGQSIWGISIWGSWALRDFLVAGQYVYALTYILISTWRIVSNYSTPSGADEPVVDSGPDIPVANGVNDPGAHGTPVPYLTNHFRKHINGFQSEEGAISTVPWVPYMATLMLGYILLNFGKFDTVPASLPLIVVCFVVSDLTISMIIHHMSKTKVLADDLIKPAIGALAMASLGIKTLDSNHHDAVLVICGSIAIASFLRTFAGSSADICAYSKVTFFSIEPSRMDSSPPFCNKKEH